uniref:Uncharacterized protein n=1 Tax=Stomoxys calcitrans TaxID=35570 RepID=A0A1I8PD76_STOCA|nr:unnamed protein product [Stomoxys calcitrans]
MLQIFAICSTLLLAGIESRPQNIFESVATGAVQMAAMGAEMVANGAAIGAGHDFDAGLVKVRSKGEAGSGSAIQKPNESSEESSEERRRKRSINSLYHDFMEMQSLLEVKELSAQQHQHRTKREPCWSGGSGGGGSGGGGGFPGTGGGGGGVPGTDGGGIDEDMLEVARRRRQQRMQAARKRKAQPKSKKTNRTSKKSVVGQTEDIEEVSSSLTRRKRQSEVEDLNATMNKTGKDISAYTQQFAEKVKGAWQSFMQSVNQMAEKVKQIFTGHTQDAGGQAEAEEI